METTKNSYYTTEEVYIPELYLEGQDRQECLISIKVSLDEEYNNRLSACKVLR